MNQIRFRQELRPQTLHDAPRADTSIDWGGRHPRHTVHPSRCFWRLLSIFGISHLDPSTEAFTLFPCYEMTTDAKSQFLWTKGFKSLSQISNLNFSCHFQISNLFGPNLKSNQYQFSSDIITLLRPTCIAFHIVTLISFHPS